MQKERVFKKRYILIPILFVLIWVGWIFYFMTFPVGHDLFKKIKVNNLVNLYITQANAGATTSFSYHYFLYDANKDDADFMDHVERETPFMITDDGTANTTVKDGQLYLRVRGNIYSYTNAGYPIRINLDASPY